ncbi:hypothetical protein CAEBREN_14481 [Caenorhabditis brenneri]|uniref:Uncharacterized protein n=1 Tax=Caenorhabditis brenneri TaxID=135651 RepID=G0NX48_CAEBE|nr:hypothetical protein CAEBREN_14481 [Caenorhabditis brenneri]
MTPSKSLKVEKKLMKMKRKSLGKQEKTTEFINMENPEKMIDENKSIKNWIPKILERLAEKNKRNESELNKAAFIQAVVMILMYLHLKSLDFSAKHHEKQAKAHWEKVLKEWN